MASKQQPEAYIGGADKLFADDGSIANPSTREFMAKYLAAFEQWFVVMNAEQERIERLPRKAERLDLDHGMSGHAASSMKTLELPGGDSPTA